MRAKITSINLAQQNGWSTRKTKFINLAKNYLRSSVYLLQEADNDMAFDVALGLGWTTSKGRPCWRTDENRNTIIWDPKKWYDIATYQVSLSQDISDIGHQHYRSANWVELRHIESKETIWFGSSHLSNGKDAGPEREAQARILASKKPNGVLVLGIDRNSLATSSPARILVDAGLADLTVGKSRLRSYPAGDTRTDGVQIDAVHGCGVELDNVLLVDPNGGTDHRGWVMTVDTDAGV